MDDRPFPGNSWWDWIVDLDHRNALVPAFPPKWQELPRSPGIPGEFPGNTISDMEIVVVGIDNSRDTRDCYSKFLSCFLMFNGSMCSVVLRSISFSAFFQ